jgi:hypothetical protein
VQGGEGKNPYETLPNHVNTNGEQMAITASSMIRSHSISGDLHGVQPDPIAADILRKEPEQEIFARLRITPMGMNCQIIVILLKSTSSKHLFTKNSCNSRKSFSNH